MSWKSSSRRYRSHSELLQHSCVSPWPCEFGAVSSGSRGPSYTLHLLSVLTVCVLPRHWGRLAGLGTGIQSWDSPKLILPPTAPAMDPHRFHSCWIMVPVWPGGTQTHLSSYTDKLILLPK